MSALWIVPTVCLAGFFALPAAVQVCALRKWPSRKSDCMIVLGAKVRADGRLSGTLEGRCAAAADAYRAGIAPTLIVCGGRGDDEPCPEAEAMRAELVRRGIPEENVILEPLSSDTVQNLTNAQKIMAANGWKTCAIVTTDYHMRRALWIARDLRLDACGVASPTGRTRKRFVKTRLREAVSWCLYWFKKRSARFSTGKNPAS